MSSHGLRQTRNYVWSVSDVLGQGATGSVYRCRHKQTGEAFAVKTFNTMSYIRPPDVQIREFEVLRKLKHRNIVSLLAIEEDTSSKVIVMELCTGGSLYNMLDDPANSYGVPEEEFLLILEHIALGLQHLHHQKIVHRDIKPGNILRYIAEDGSSIYKLTDFGAARELPEEGQFMSLYGTEEYLHPDMYERAVLRQPSEKQFGASVDLWSLGVTLYHVCTGQLPFRPYGGRRNKAIMHKITTQKEPGVISGVQVKEGGEIIWSKTLPKECLISVGLENLLTPLLAGLLECQPKRIWSFDKFFSQAFEVCAKSVVHLFNVSTGSLIRIYIKKDASYAKFQELIAEQTDIAANDQILIYETQHFSHLVTAIQPISTYPETTLEHPVFLFPRECMQFPQMVFYIPECPPIPSSSINTEVDYSVAKLCCAALKQMQRRLSLAVLTQRLMDEATETYGNVLMKDVMHMKDYSTHFINTLKELAKRISYLGDQHRCTRNLVMLLGKSILPEDGSMILNDLDILVTNQQLQLQETTDGTDQVKKNCDELYRQLVTKHVLSTMWKAKSGCTPKDRCVPKIQLLIESTEQIVKDFRKDKQLRRLPYSDEHIHQFSRNRLTENCTKASSLLQEHCYKNHGIIHEKLEVWLKQAYKSHEDVRWLEHELDRLIDKLDEQSIKQDEAQKVYIQMLTSLLSRVNASGDSSLAKSGGSSSGQSSKNASYQKTLLKQLNEDLQSLRVESNKIKSSILENSDLMKKLEDLSLASDRAEMDVLDAISSA